MADNKQYITQELENGSIHISEDVLAAIVTEAVGEVEGLAGFATKLGADIVDMLGKKNWGKGLRLTLDEDEVFVEVDVNVCYGQSVLDVAKNAQETIKNNIESMTGLTVSGVSVNICGIVQK